MDDQRFDDLARALAVGTDRRRVLAGIAGAALALLGTSGVGAERKKPKKPKKAKKRDCGDPAVTGSFCGGIAGIGCSGGYECVDDPDGCGPQGGADCSGTCRPICGGEPCNQVVCGEGFYCCNFSCSTCAPLGGFCTLQACGE